MGRPRRVHCVKCNRHLDECGPLSTRGQCEDCSVAGVTDAIVQVSSRTGPVYDKWVLGTLRHAQRVADSYAPDDVD